MGKIMVKPMLTLILACLLGFQAGMALQAAELKVFAAASLTDALQEISRGYEKSSGNKVVFNFGASSFLARQIEEGAPADLFFSADETRMNGLEEKGLIAPGTRRGRLSNSLVIVVPQDSTIKIQSATNLMDARIKKIALADPKAVPAGVYAKAYLEHLKLWSQIERKVVPTDNVRTALAAVESGDVEAGIVYKTDAAISKRVKIAYEVPPGEGPRISYRMGVIKESKQLVAASQLLEYFDSTEAGIIFEKYGFIVLGKNR
jgi:molybdate transport system substrate-binding protein